MIFTSIALTLALAGSDARPNVVLVMTDDQGYGDFGFLGAKALETPRLDRLAAESARVDAFYVCPVCAPTRASLMTGRYHYRTRVVDTWLGRAQMDPDEVTVAERLRDAGYRTGVFGKWHLGDCLPMRPQDQGFERTLVHRGGGIGQPSDPPGGEAKYTDPTLFEDGVERRFEGYCTDIFFDHAVRFIDEARAAEQPFFCVVTTNAPHGPFDDVPAEALAATKARVADDRTARIFAMIENIDANLGHLVDHLDAAGIGEETLLLFLTDNGPNGPGRAGPFRGQKGDVHEGGVRTPLLARWPGRLPAGHVVRRFGAHIDLAPTILEACGVDAGQGVRFDGRSLLPLLEGRDVEWPGRTLVIQAHRGDRPFPEHHFMLRTDRWKLVHPSGFGRESFEGAPRFELYDLVADPTEANDLAADHPEEVTRLRAAYRAWLDDVSASRGFDPPPIRVGDARENPSVLTRQDWRTEGGSWSRDGRGVWWLDVTEEATFEVTIRFPSRGYALELVLDARDVRRRRSVDAAATEVTIDDLRLPAGPTRLAVHLRAPGLDAGPLQVELRRVE